jgi:hypothetical protein
MIPIIVIIIKALNMMKEIREKGCCTPLPEGKQQNEMDFSSFPSSSSDSFASQNNSNSYNSNPVPDISNIPDPFGNQGNSNFNATYGDFNLYNNSNINSPSKNNSFVPSKPFSMPSSSSSSSSSQYSSSSASSFPSNYDEDDKPKIDDPRYNISNMPEKYRYLKNKLEKKAEISRRLKVCQAYADSDDKASLNRSIIEAINLLSEIKQMK